MTTTSTRGSVAQPQVVDRSPEARASASAREAARPMPRGPVRRLFRLIADVVRKSDRDRMLGLAGENAFMAVLTTFPILLVAAAVLGQLSIVIGADNAKHVEDSVLQFLQDLLTNSASPAIQTARDLFETSGNTLTIALVLALCSLAQAFASIINTVTLTYDVRDPRGWWYRRALGLVVGVGSVLMAVLVVTLVVVGPLFAPTDLLRLAGLDALWLRLRWPVAFLALILWGTTMFYVCPGRVASWRRGLPGGLLSSVLWLGASAGFNLYLNLALETSPVFGALGGGLIVMTWLYLLCFGLLCGAELNAVLLTRRQLAGEAPRTPAARRARRRAVASEPQ
ncbi:MAG TPA: YihY/virulence factor BrkB family protein [Mycobacteriales bacterium]|nr:YihY/virulence factor BrkB family protein [Mycobacteriales bacterium]